ncbi:NERD domain-containing protein [Methylococcus sp. EFPC2]|uniref:NERD domain-containing protein n=1 Tax=Methylococcus sp. EFPC2 TaxID=2812648 RepID=UPI00196785CB|nr:NERD domain-containing protein [Methylococcus sp. EFPC2]QSA99352.1 NERD domain-containing protein [Methylococcus sp. EFPC2]
MDFSPLLIPLWHAMKWLIPLAVLAAIIQSPWFKGLVGEWLVRFAAWLRLDKAEYRALHDVTLPTPDGTTQIDHVFVSRYGVFVVETKNYSGWIFGGEQQPTWTQKIYRTTNKFQNPLRQNYKHLKALETLLNVPAATLHSVIVFVGGSTFKTPMPPNVTYAGGYIRYIKSFKEPVFSAAEVDEIVEAISSGRLKPDLATTRDHVRRLKSRNNRDAPRLCPRCGSPMVLREVKKGANAGNSFWGCSQFPKCRAIQNV